MSDDLHSIYSPPDILRNDVIIQQELKVFVEMINSFIELNWYHKDILVKIQVFLDKYNHYYQIDNNLNHTVNQPIYDNNNNSSNNNNSNSVQFNYGLLEELFLHYKLKCYQKPSESILKFGGRILSKFFHINFH